MRFIVRRHQQSVGEGQGSARERGAPSFHPCLVFTVWSVSFNTECETQGLLEVRFARLVPSGFFCFSLSIASFLTSGPHSLKIYANSC